DLFVARRPPETGHFVSQRVRQAYDEWARPARFAAQLALLPAALFAARRHPAWLAVVAAAAVVVAEAGRRRGGGVGVFPATSALWAPAWLGGRAVTSWLALGARLALGGVRYRSGRLKHAATPRRALAGAVRNRQLAGPEPARPLWTASGERAPRGAVGRSGPPGGLHEPDADRSPDRKSTRLNSSHV